MIGKQVRLTTEALDNLPHLDDIIYTVVGAENSQGDDHIVCLAEIGKTINSKFLTEHRYQRQQGDVNVEG